VKTRYQRFFSKWRNLFATMLVLIFVFVSIAAPLLSPDDPLRPGPYKVVGRVSDLEPKPPSEKAPLGTLRNQISVYHLLVWGTRGAMEFGLIVAISTALLGIIIGATAGYTGGVVNRLFMQITDAFLTFPVIAGVVLLNQLWLNALVTNGGTIVPGVGGTSLSPGGAIIGLSNNVFKMNPGILIQAVLSHIDPLIICLIFFSWMPYARLVNTLVIELKQTDFILAARSIGLRPWRILYRHILPNAITPAVVLLTRDVGSFVIFQATLTFIGLGGGSLWGSLLVNGRNWILGPGGSIFTYWWVFIPATLAVILFGITWNLFGDGLGELLDPYNR
jgi:peptide/nickel transport system permease protein